MSRTILPIGSLALIFLLIGPIAPWNSAFTLLERSFFAFILFAGTVIFTQQKPRLVALSTPLLLLIFTATLSLTQFGPITAIKDWLSFLIVAFIAMYAAWTFSTETIVFSIALAGFILAAYTVYLYFASPTTSIDEAGLLMGAFTGKNNLALTLMFTVPAILTTKFISVMWLRIVSKTAVVLLMFILILATRSASSIVAFILVILTFGAMLLVRRYRKSLRWVIGFALVSLGAVLLNFTSILAIFSKGSDLTGRIPLWTSSFHAMENKWVTGYGWSYLFGYDHPAALFIQNELNQFFLHSHNEFIYWFVMTGIFGAAFLLATYISTIFLGIKHAVFTQKNLHLWIPLAALGLVYGGVTEISSAYIQGWFVLVLIVSALGKFLANIPEKSRGLNWLIFLEWESHKTNQPALKHPSQDIETNI